MRPWLRLARPGAPPPLPRTAQVVRLRGQLEEMQRQREAERSTSAEERSDLRVGWAWGRWVWGWVWRWVWGWMLCSAARLGLVAVGDLPWLGSAEGSGAVGRRVRAIP